MDCESLIHDASLAIVLEHGETISEAIALPFIHDLDHCNIELANTRSKSATRDGAGGAVVAGHECRTGSYQCGP